MKHFTILITEAIKQSVIDSAAKLAREHPELGTPELVLVSAHPHDYEQFTQAGVRIIACDYTDASIKELLASIKEPIKAVVCRGDKYVQYLRRLALFLPPNVPVSSPEALEAATNKRRMRAAFHAQYPEITPQFVQVDAASQDSVETKLGHLQFPVIIKPASLASSLLIQKCNTMAELKEHLTETFAVLDQTYRLEGRSEPPEVIVEEFLTGDFYSIDSYVMAAGKIWHCPLVSYVPAEQLGIDDFFLYKRSTPVSLPQSEVAAAELTAAKAIQAAQLCYSSVHVELIKTANGWKVIEIGPRIGRFRNIMYNEAYGIDHGYNDLLIHLGLKPVLPKVSAPKGCVAYSIYPHQEGILKEVTGLSGIEKLQSTVYFRNDSHVGRRVLQAKHGGHALCEVILAADSPAQLNRDADWFEHHVEAIVA